MPVKYRSIDEFTADEKKVRATYFLERRAFQIRFTGEDIGEVDQDQHHKIWDGGRTWKGTNYSCVWTKIVRFAASNDVDPCKLVEAVFAVHTNSKPPEPTMMHGQHALECYGRYKVMFRDKLKLRHQLLTSLFDREVWTLSMLKPTVSKSDIYIEVLISPTTDFDALFKFVKACNLGLTDLARRCYHSALMQYMEHSEMYDEVMGNELPKPFQQAARDQRDRLLRG